MSEQQILRRNGLQIHVDADGRAAIAQEHHAHLRCDGCSEIGRTLKDFVETAHALRARLQRAEELAQHVATDRDDALENLERAESENAALKERLAAFERWATRE